MRYHPAKQLSLFLSIVIGCLVLGCSNSEGVDYAGWEYVAEEDEVSAAESFYDSKVDYLPIDDSEYPYAGIPRIVIETLNHQQIKDRETEIPAKLQVWGEKAPESEVMDLTIRGRGNSTWNYPKKPYAIKFNEKQSFLDMPKAKKWVMLANYRDRTLIRNAVAFELARHTSLKWTPSGKFADVFLNGKFLGNYYICEKIEVKKNRLELETNGFLIEFDANYDEDYKFRSSYKNFPINIKHPNEPSNDEFVHIQSYIDTIECILYGSCLNVNIQKYLNLHSAASYWIVQEVSQNEEIIHPKSLFAYKDSNLNIGPVWDFDWQTFTSLKKGLRNKNYFLLDSLRKNRTFIQIVKQEWNTSKHTIKSLTNFIDSISAYTFQSNEINHQLWPINTSSGHCGDETISLDSAIHMLKTVFLNRTAELDSLFNAL